MGKVRVGDFSIGEESPLIFIAGPCVIESEEMILETASVLKGIADRLKVSFIFKSSFDKANRTSVDSFRGPGLKAGLEILQKVKDELDLPVLTDIHHPEQAEIVARVVDVLQIPAFLCRQTDLLLAAARTGKVINVKKGQFISPWDVKHILEKVYKSGNDQVFVTERGYSFGYNNLVADMRSIPLMQQLGVPVIFDATHSAQLPGSGDGETGGMREMVPVLARSAAAAGADGLFMEVHPDPEKARSDQATQWYLHKTEELWNQVKMISEISGKKDDRR